MSLEAEEMHKPRSLGDAQAWKPRRCTSLDVLKIHEAGSLGDAPARAPAQATVPTPAHATPLLTMTALIEAALHPIHKKNIGFA